MKVTVDLPNEVVSRLVQAHLEDGEPVAEKILVLVENGLKILDQIERKRIVLSVATKVSSTTRHYLDQVEWLFDSSVD